MINGAGPTNWELLADLRTVFFILEGLSHSKDFSRLNELSKTKIECPHCKALQLSYSESEMHLLHPIECVDCHKLYGVNLKRDEKLDWQLEIYVQTQ